MSQGHHGEILIILVARFSVGLIEAIIDLKSSEISRQSIPNFLTAVNVNEIL